MNEATTTLTRAASPQHASKAALHALSDAMRMEFGPLVARSPSDDSHGTQRDGTFVNKMM